ncbi:hypothetical protein [Archangium lansingense]|uniref:Uncharacterized protein n=1 Tax=Archangium lansingense TaxID=2995310 RepID=A0ABT3ZWD6_9BACT|nr:hypothetical protein [Archangium lansinium]MCY1073616.1 hypothetical protein [Archangium lansinium]
MLQTAMNEWAIKAIQLETALMALDEVGLPASMKGLQEKAEQAMLALVRGWLEQKPKADERKWKVTPAQEGASPKDEELADVVSHLKEEGVEWSVYLATSDKGDSVETLVAEDRGWMAAGGEYYSGQWDEDTQQLEVGRDDEEGELGTGLVFTLTGELVYESQIEG